MLCGFVLLSDSSFLCFQTFHIHKIKLPISYLGTSGIRADGTIPSTAFKPLLDLSLKTCLGFKRCYFFWPPFCFFHFCFLLPSTPLWILKSVIQWDNCKWRSHKNFRRIRTKCYQKLFLLCEIIGHLLSSLNFYILTLCI